jgi:hypothetical protein
LVMKQQLFVCFMQRKTTQVYQFYFAPFLNNNKQRQQTATTNNKNNNDNKQYT